MRSATLLGATAVLLCCGGGNRPVGGDDQLSTPAPAQAVYDAPPPDGPPIGGAGTCVGYWRLVQTTTTRTTCPAGRPIDQALIVDVVQGRYRARRADGGWLQVLSASGLGEDCKLSVRAGWHVEAIDTAYSLDWELTSRTASGVLRDLEPWTSCEHAFAADVTRRDLRDADVTFDPQRAAAEFLSYWRDSCAPHYAKLPRGTGSVRAEVVLTDDGRIDRVDVDGKDIWFACSMYRCSCPDLTNPSGQPQRFVVDLPRP